MDEATTILCVHGNRQTQQRKNGNRAYDRELS
jgi:hypothetical protein